MITDLGSGIGPMVLGLIIAAAGYRDMYLSCAVISLVSLMIYWAVHGRLVKNGQNMPKT
jgi:predicted MFS family arabinose efflux permease